MLSALTLENIIGLVGSIGTAATAVAALVALVYAKGQVREAQRQLRQSRRVANGDFLLRLDEAFQRHNETHKRLQPMFEWGQNELGKSKGGPSTNEDWFAVTSYMGLLERVNYLVKRRIVKLAIIDKLYGYRVSNVVSNDIIRKTKLETPTAEYYQEFIQLWLALKELHPQWRDYPGITLIPSAKT